MNPWPIVGAIVLGGLLAQTPKQITASLCEQPRIFVRMAEVDDVASLYVQGALYAQSYWGYRGTEPGTLRRIGHRPGDSDWLDVTDTLQHGENVLTLMLWNNPGCCAFRGHFIIRKGEEVVFEHTIRRRDGSEGIKYQQDITVTLTPCTQANT